MPLTFKQKVNILKTKAKLTEFPGVNWHGFSLNAKSQMMDYGKTIEEAVKLAEDRGWFDKYEKN